MFLFQASIDPPPLPAFLPPLPASPPPPSVPQQTSNSTLGRVSAKGSLQSFTLAKPEEVHELKFQFNPTTIEERRAVQYNFSDAQGQVFPLAQYGRLEPTELHFELFMFRHSNEGSALEKELNHLRTLTLPRSVSKREYYNQVQPFMYTLSLGNYGIFFGVVRSVDIKTDLYDKNTLAPNKVTAKVIFVVTASSEERNNTMLRSYHAFGQG